ncbi:hypothetical protein GT037_010973 [Alternaria burnsii]|uniref:Uncharacterized protein n=1 Tax=Alternaria burnsii TaxID=1187904 RepID=A0A8H7EAR8_9PLEO|nr:uncharacterized protein GT037_010973 [Alternaria burnsii]KAF7671009.1 hypothetical protein GT037_010973 [Alternaria burnsii]
MADFFGLPRELRDRIYKFYFEVEGGYAYNFSTGKLTSASGQPIELALRSVSRFFREETCGLALGLNTLHFSSEYNHSLQRRAGHFNALLGILEELKTRYLVWGVSMAGLFGDTTYAHVEAQHPQYTSLIRKTEPGYVFAYPWRECWKDTPSKTRQFVTSTLAAVAAHPDFLTLTENTWGWTPKGSGYDDPREVIVYNYVPWKIPTEEDIIAMKHVLGTENRVDDVKWNELRYLDRFKYRFSAASVAISFLESMSLVAQLQIRKIVLHEKNRAVAWSQCHAQGFIPFCQRNPKLRIERRVDLWKAILPDASGLLIDNENPRSANARPDPCDSAQADSITSGFHGQGCIASWIMEVMYLHSLGMPPQSFRMVIDGDLTPTQSTRIFDVAKRDAAWQIACEACLSDRRIWQTALDSWEIRHWAVYIMDGFPEALRAMTNGQSPVSCNFEIGPMPDTESLVSQGRTWTLEEWGHNWRASLPANIDTEVPSCSWLDLQRENTLPPTTPN